LSRGWIVTAAIELAHSAGLAAVAMGRVAARLGFTTMSLYRHVGNKDELILLMQDAAIGVPPDLATGRKGWRTGLERWAWAALAAFRAHPWLPQAIAVIGPPITPNQLAWLEQGLRLLGPTPLREPEKVHTMLLLDGHIFGDLQFAACHTSAPTSGPDADPYRPLLEGMADPGPFPALRRAVEGGAFDAVVDPAADRDAQFAFGLARILDGVQRLVEERLGGATANGDR